MTGVKEHLPTLSGVSAETGKDWTALTALEKAHETHQQQEFLVPGGSSVRVYQVQGFCDHGTVYTETLKVEEVVVTTTTAASNGTVTTAAPNVNVTTTAVPNVNVTTTIAPPSNTTELF